MNGLLEKLREFINKLNDKGIPMPMVRDPLNGKASVSLTLLFLSSCYVQLALINKFAKVFEGVDIDNSLEFFMICAGLYFGRSISKKVAQPHNPEDKGNL